MDWTFWLGLVGIVVLWVLIRWGNGLWRRHAQRTHGRVHEVDGTEAADAPDARDVESPPERSSRRDWFDRPID